MSSLSFYDDFDQTEKKGDEASAGLFSPFTFLILTLILVLFGLLMLYSATFDYAVENGRPHYFYLEKQMIGLAAGFIAGLVLRLLPFRTLKRLHYFFSFISVALFAVYFIRNNDLSGIIRIGGVPFADVTATAIFSAVLSFSSTVPVIEKSERFGLFYCILIIYHIAIALCCAFAGGLGSFIAYSAVIIIMMRPCGISRGYAVLASCFAAVIFISLFFSVPSFIGFFSESVLPVEDSALYSSSMLSSISAIREGGLTGTGIGKGIFKMMNIAGTESFFIFTTAAEELGILGICCILLIVFLYNVLSVRTANRAVNAGNHFIASSSLGLSAMLVIPFILSALRVLSIFPFSGTLMPLFAFCPGNEVLYIASSYLLYREIFIMGRMRNDRLE